MNKGAFVSWVRHWVNHKYATDCLRYCIPGVGNVHARPEHSCHCILIQILGGFPIAIIQELSAGDLQKLVRRWERGCSAVSPAHCASAPAAEPGCGQRQLLLLEEILLRFWDICRGEHVMYNLSPAMLGHFQISVFLQITCVWCCHTVSPRGKCGEKMCWKISPWDCLTGWVLLRNV